MFSLRPFAFILFLSSLASAEPGSIASGAALSADTEPSSGAVETPPASVESNREESRKYYKAGNEAFLGGDKHAARAHYLRALKLDRQWDILCNLGRVEGEMGLDAEALAHLDECLKEYPPSTDKKVQAARAKFFDLRVEIRDRCRRVGCAYKEPHVSSGLEAAPIVATATVSEPNAPAVGEPSKQPTAALDPERHPAVIYKNSAKWPVVITTGVLGAVGVGLGVGFLVASEDKKNEAFNLGDDCLSSDRACGDFDAARQSYFDLRSASNAGFIAGGALVGAAIITAIVWPHPGVSAARNFLPVANLSDKGAYFGLGGRF
jgi:tetratricopeptide (TPR) repeat protein